MDDLTKAVIFNGAVELSVNSKTYHVRPLNLSEIVSDEFINSKLHCPGKDEPPASWQAIFLSSEDYRKQVDKWMRRLLTLDGGPQTLDSIAADGWTDADIGRFLALVLQISGLTRRDQSGNEEPTPPEIWLDAITELQYRGHLQWDEIMSMPLLRVNAVRERLSKQAAQDITGSMSSLLGTTQGAAQTRPKNAIFGETPQFDSREDYFNWVNKHRGN